MGGRRRGVRSVRPRPSPRGDARAADRGHSDPVVPDGQCCAVGGWGVHGRERVLESSEDLFQMLFSILARIKS